MNPIYEQIETSVFERMSALAVKHDAVNLGQGFPDYPIDPKLAECVTEAVAAGFNQYAPMEGSIALRAAIVARITAAASTPDSSVETVLDDIAKSVVPAELDLDVGVVGENRSELRPDDALQRVIRE